MSDIANKVETLMEAMPYLQKYQGKIIVIKYGGNAMINEELKHDVMRDMVLMSLIGVKMVLVHGGGPEISSMLKRVGKETEFIDGLRVTDEETSEIVQMVLAGKINKSLVAKLDNLGGRAMGICGCPPRTGRSSSCRRRCTRSGRSRTAAYPPESALQRPAARRVR